MDTCPCTRALIDAAFRRATSLARAGRYACTGAALFPGAGAAIWTAFDHWGGGVSARSERRSLRSWMVMRAGRQRKASSN